MHDFFNNEFEIIDLKGHLVDHLENFDLKNIIKSNKKKKMNKIAPVFDYNWYEIEEKTRVIDHGLIGNNKTFTSEIYCLKHKKITMDCREKILIWIADACKTYKWTYSTFYTAIHAFDCFFSATSLEIPIEDLSTLSVACILYSAKVRESMYDENVPSFEELKVKCTNIGPNYKICEYEMKMLGVVKNINYNTPYTILMTIINNFIHFEPFDVFLILLTKVNLINLFVSDILHFCTMMYINGEALIMPQSTFVIASVLYLMLGLKCFLMKKLCSNCGDEKFNQRKIVEIENIDKFSYASANEIARILIDDICDFPGGCKSFYYIYEYFEPILAIFMNSFEYAGNLCDKLINEKFSEYDIIHSLKKITCRFDLKQNNTVFKDFLSWKNPAILSNRKKLNLLLNSSICFLLSCEKTPNKDSKDEYDENILNDEY